MSKKNTGQGFGLAVIGLILLAAAFFITFYGKKCILGTIIAVVSATLSTAAYIEARRGGGPRKFTLSILLIAWLGAIFSIIWTASGSKRVEKMNVPVQEVAPEVENEIDKEKKLEELEEKAEELEEPDSID